MPGLTVVDAAGRLKEIESGFDYAELTGELAAHADASHALPAGVVYAKASMRTTSPYAPSGTVADIGSPRTPGVVNGRVTWWVAPRTETLVRLQWFTGAISAGNYDLAIYSADGLTQLWHKGVTAFPPVAAAVNEAPGIALVAGTTYVILWATDSTTAQTRAPMIQNSLFGDALDSTGVAIMAADPAASSIPLPATYAIPSRSADKIGLAYRMRAF